MLLGSFLAEAQTPKQWLKMGDAATEDNDHFGAAHYYRKAIDSDSSEAGVYYKYATALRLYNEYSKAEGAYKTVYDMDSEREYPDALFWQAMMQKYNGDYEGAIINFELFRDVAIDRSSYEYKKAKQEIGSCAFALDLLKDTVDVEVSNLGERLNSIGSEFSAVMVSDTLIYFSSLRNDSIGDDNTVLSKKYFVRISKGFKLNGQWISEGAIDTAINHPREHQANGAMSLDSNRFYFSRCPMPNECALWVATRGLDDWTAARKLPEAINYPGASTTQPCIANIDDEEVLIYASNREGGRGKFDLWYIPLKKGGSEYGKPRNFGSKINSIDNEITPYYDVGTGALYFSSDWHYGLGGFDVFKTTGGLKPDEPENLGYPINSSVNDMYYVIDTIGKYGFLTSNRIGSITAKGETCCNDLYAVTYPVEIPTDTVVRDTFVAVVEKRIPIRELDDYLPVLYFHNDEPNPRTWDSTTTLSYSDAFTSYKALQSTYLERYSQGSNKTKEECDAAMNSFFADKVDYGMQVLEAFAERLLNQLDSGLQIELTVKGYASPLAKTNYNVNLTKRRIASFENYLRAYKDGAYIPYLNKTAANGATLHINRIPYGEYLADQSVSANVNDQRNSVYAVKAGMERKIEVLSATRPNPDHRYAEASFGEEIHDFGKVLPGQKLKHRFKFTNTGNEPLLIENVQPACGCTVANFTKTEIAPGGSGFVELTFDTKGRLGNQLKTATVYSNGDPKQQVLTITTEVITEEEVTW